MKSVIFKTVGIFISACIALALILALLIYILLGTEGGSRFALDRALTWTGDNLGINISYGGIAGTLSGGLAFEDLRVHQAKDDGATLEISADDFSANWSLLPLLDRQLRVDSIYSRNLRVVTTAADQPSTEATDLEGILQSLFNLPVSIHVGDVRLENTSMDIDGLALQAPLLESDALALNEQRLDANGFHMLFEGIDVAADATMQADGLTFTSDVDWRVIDPAGLGLTFLPDAPTGNLSINGDLDNLTLTHRVTSPISLVSTGSVSPNLLSGAPVRFDLRHEAANLAALLPALPDDVVINRLGGTLTTGGTLDAISVQMDFMLDSNQAAPLDIGMGATYTGETVQLEEVAIASDEIDLRASGLVALEPLGLDLAWRLGMLDLGERLTQVDLHDVSGSGNVVLNLSDDTAVSATLSGLSATLNGYPLNASGEIAMLNEVVTALELDIQNAANSLALSGSIGEAMDISWSLQLPEPETLLPTLNGALSGQGTFSGSLESPRIVGSLSADTVSYALDESIYRLDSAEAEITTSLNDYNFSFTLSGLSIPMEGDAYTVEQARIGFNGDVVEHQLSLMLDSRAAALDIAMTGGYVEGVWTGNVDRSSIESDYGDWRLADAFNLQAGPEAVDYGSHCWIYEDISICSDGVWSASEGFDLQAAIAGLPLGWLNSTQVLERAGNDRLSGIANQKPAGVADLQESFSVQLPPNTYIDGVVAADFRATGNLQDIANASINLTVQPENVTLNLLLEQISDQQTRQPESLAFEIQDMQLQASQQPGGLRQASAGFNVFERQESGLTFQGDLDAELALAANENLSGNIAFNFLDISWLETLVPNITNTSGSITADATVEGTLSRPLFLAEIALTDGAFGYPLYGVSPRNVSLLVKSGEENRLDIEGSAESGEGSIRLTGTVYTPLQPTRSFTLAVEGEGFQATNTGSMQLTVSPDLRVNFEDNSLLVEGALHIPVLMLDMTEAEALNTGQVTVSDDAVVVVAPVREGESASTGGGTNIPILLDVELTLGDMVRFQGYGLALALTGDLQLRQTEDRPLLGYGNITITEGSYEIYRQELMIESGELVFFGNLSNPVLNIRAYREAGAVRAGVQINGTLQSMQSQLYSTPALPQGEILSILVTGKSMNNVNEQDEDALVNAIANLGIGRGEGVTNAVRNQLGLDTLAINAEEGLDESSIGLGKYLTSDIFISYDVGLFDKESSLSLDYFLNDRLKLEVKSGVSQSIDLTYTFEK